MKKILLTNDDGINADGLKRLAEAAREFGEVWILAPDDQRSAASHSVTLRNSVIVWPVEYPVEDVHAYACDGTPADCVRIGVLNLVPGKPDHVFSGINYGFNLAADIQYSATAGAAFEAAFQEIHTIAFSEALTDNHEVTDRYLMELMGELMEQPLGVNEIWNVNFPGCPLAECKGVLRDRVVSTDPFYNDRYSATELEDGRTAYMVDGIRNWNASEGTDLRAALDGYVSVGIAKNIS